MGEADSASGRHRNSLNPITDLSTVRPDEGNP